MVLISILSTSFWYTLLNVRDNNAKKKLGRRHVGDVSET
jgi:hypothetical protein